MDTQRYVPASPSQPVSVMPGEAEHDESLAEAARKAVPELRNRLLVFYSASAWARGRCDEGAVEIRRATRDLEGAAEALRGTLLSLMSSLERARSNPSPDVMSRLVPEAGVEVLRFVEAAEAPMVTLRRSLMLCGVDGVELMADLEDALAGVRTSSSTLRP